MTDERVTPQDGPRLSAADLRREMAEIQMARADAAAAKRAKLEAAQMAQINAFMTGHITPDDLDRLRLKVQSAVADGHTEVEVMRFPSSLLSDKGRAVNAGRSDWPQTLTGKAAEAYAIYRQRVAPAGYALYARILDYPGGLLGDVGLFLSWAGDDK